MAPATKTNQQAPAAPAAGPTAPDQAPAAGTTQDQAPAATYPTKAAAAVPAAKVKLPRERNGRDADTAARALLFRVCQVFGVDPNREKRPKELEAWTFYPGDEVDGIPAAVSIVTCGGQKLRMFEDDTVDEATEQTLARIFRLAVKPGEPVDLPEDLTLPAPYVHGLVTSKDHQYPGGYLRAGGRKEAARRAAVKTKK